jgi:hypothetical protein
MTHDHKKLTTNPELCAIMVGQGEIRILFYSHKKNIKLPISFSYIKKIRGKSKINLYYEQNGRMVLSARRQCASDVPSCPFDGAMYFLSLV